MDLHITPEPPPEEREAIEAALRKLLRGPALPQAYTSAWRRAGIRDSIDQAVARPRRSFGATRA
jgi:hypothetical protein